MSTGSAREQQSTIDDSNAKLLSLISEMGVPAPVVSALLEMGGHQMNLDDARFLRGPILYHKGPSNWGKTIPKWMFDQVRAERTEIALGKLRMPVGPTEIAVVMYPAAMEAPLHYLSTQLYLWASTHAAARYYRKPVEEYWKMLNQEPIPDREVLEPKGLLYQHYKELASEIRRKVINAQVRRERHQKSMERRNVVRHRKPSRTSEIPIEVSEPKPPGRRSSNHDVQPSLFSWLLKGIVGE